MNKMMRITTMLTCLIFGSIAMNASALPAHILVGMSPQEVFKLRGEPLSKDERETSRKILWKYKDGVVVFYNGKVIDVVEKSAKKESSKKTYFGQQKAKKGTGEDLSQKEVDDIIAAIPNDTGKPAANAGPGGASSQ